VTSVEAELMAIHTGLIPAIERDNIHDIIVITDSIATAKKILESKVDPLQNIFIPIASAIKTYLKKNGRNKIHFWYCPSRAKWPRHQLVNDQVNVSLYSPAKSHTYSVKRRNVITSSMNGKSLLQIASKKANTSWTLKMKNNKSLNQHTLKGDHGFLS